MAKPKHDDPHETDLEWEIKELEARAEEASRELAQMEQDAANRLKADELRQQVEQLEAEVAQRHQTKKD